MNKAKVLEWLNFTWIMIGIATAFTPLYAPEIPGIALWCFATIPYAFITTALLDNNTKEDKCE